jgi:hypothetical protein
VKAKRRAGKVGAAAYVKAKDELRAKRAEARAGRE